MCAAHDTCEAPSCVHAQNMEDVNFLMLGGASNYELAHVANLAQDGSSGLASSSHTYLFSLLAFIVSVGSEMSLSDFCADVSKADKFKDRAMKVFECNEIDEVGDLQWTTAAKMEKAALQAMKRLPQDLECEPLWSHGVGAFIQRVFAKEAALREA